MLKSRIKARYASRKNYLEQVLPSSLKFLDGLEKKGACKTTGMRVLQRLYAEYSKERLEEAMQELIKKSGECLGALKLLLQEDPNPPTEKRPDLRARPELENIIVKSHDLASYEDLTPDKESCP